MKERITTVTRKGQITIPAEFRRAMGLQEGDKVAIVMENGHVHLAPRGSVVKRTAGIFKSYEPPRSAEDLRTLAEESVAQDVIESMG